LAGGGVIRALTSHPLRLQIIRAVALAGELAPKDLAAQLEVPLGNVSYHVRELVDAGVLRATKTEPVRGTLKHFYAVDRASLLRGLGELGREIAAVRAAAGLNGSVA
jgi:DNA-binding transcriptional ArsR family regulator